MKVLDVKWKPLEKPYNGLMSGHLTYNGYLQVLVDKRPDKDERVYKRYGDYLYSENDGFVSTYKHEKGTTEGFAGAVITLNIEGKQTTFKGSLWDATGYDDTSGLPEYRAISLTDDPEVMKKGHMFWHSYITKSLYEDLCKKVKIENTVLGPSRL